MLALLKAALDQSVVGDVVWADAVMKHARVHLHCSCCVADLQTGLDHARVDKDARLDTFSSHVLQDAQRFVDVSHSLVYLCEDRKCDVRWLDLEFAHVAEALEGHVGFVRFEATIK